MTSNRSILESVFACIVGLIVITWWCLGDPSRFIYLPGNVILLTGIIIGLVMYKGDYNKNLDHAVVALIIVLILMWIVIGIMIFEGYSISLVTIGVLSTLASVFISYFELIKWKKSQKEPENPDKSPLTVTMLSKLKNTNILKITIGILVFVVLAYVYTSSSTSATNETKTFSDGDMSFNYPADFKNVTYTVDVNDSSMQLIGKLYNPSRNRVQTIWIAKNISAFSPAEARDKVVSIYKNMSKAEIVSITSETNPNGVVVEKIIHTDEVEIGKISRYSEMFFKINNSVYRIVIYGDNTEDMQKIIANTTNIIFQSIK